MKLSRTVVPCMALRLSSHAHNKRRRRSNNDDNDAHAASRIIAASNWGSLSRRQLLRHVGDSGWIRHGAKEQQRRLQRFRSSLLDDRLSTGRQLATEREANNLSLSQTAISISATATNPWIDCNSSRLVVCGRRSLSLRCPTTTAESPALWFDAVSTKNYGVESILWTSSNRRGGGSLTDARRRQQLVTRVSNNASAQISDF